MSFCSSQIYTSKKTRLKQSKERKDKAPRYCKQHKIHYMKECPYCCGYQQVIDENAVQRTKNTG